MAEFTRTEGKVVNVGEPVIFENNTDSDFSVSTAIVFRKSGLYDVSIVGRRTIISKVAERKKGEWTKNNSCPFCGFLPWYENDIHTLSFCPNCGNDMRGEQDEK